MQREACDRAKKAERKRGPGIHRASGRVRPGKWLSAVPLRRAGGWESRFACACMMLGGICLGRMEPGRVQSRGKGALLGWDAGARAARTFAVIRRARESRRNAGRGLAWRSHASLD